MGKLNGIRLLYLLFLIFQFDTCFAQSDDYRLVDSDATPKTEALYRNLRIISGKHLLFGHQDDLAYGVGWQGQKGRSDVKEVTGSYPAVYGWDIAHIGGEENIDGVDFKNMIGWIKEGYKRGGIITISWHMENPVTNTSSWDTTRAVYSIIPGGENHELYKAELDTVADFLAKLKTGIFGRPIPVIFRPFHEHTGTWFWWGKTHATAEEYIKLWQFTVHYLKDIKGLHHLLYAYSPDRFRNLSNYLEFYPGDQYVDILGIDDYVGFRNSENALKVVDKLKKFTDLAAEKNKIAVISEVGVEGVPITDWWTNVLLNAIQADPKTKRIVYVMAWRNANERHHYASYPGHSSAEDFKKFKESQFVLFEDDLPDMYR